MTTAKQHQNKPLISITDGKKLGEVKDLYFDASLSKVTAAFLGAEGLLNRKSLAIERAAIQVYGIDAWLVAGSDKVVDLDTLAGADTFVPASSLRGREIHSDGGTKLAAIEDVVLDAEANVLGFTLGKVYVQGPLAERKTIARSAIASVSGKDKPMPTTLAQAETAAVPDV